MPREITYNWLDRPAELTAQEALFVSRLKANEDAAYDELVRTYSGPIYHVAYRMTGDAAEASDAVQDIFLKIFRNIGGFKGEAALKTWIFKIAFSEILNRLRWWKRRHRYATLSLDESPNGNTPGDGVADAGPTPEEVLQAKEREDAIQQALRRLSHEHRSIIVLRDIEGFSYTEIADVLGISMGTVKSRLARARADLKKSLMRYLSVRYL
ncbi:MAG: RNA polymerase subunit sigma-24 [Acidobacteria bacterium]|nr:MAG: RNA polymerase subunit sigma-24 [Acidobacteriota bacterium]PYS17976.1 MAG: RNA polymerase subunit sigma-24 [Acidobacteriota bacterium]